jgi:hypothetical protein
MDRLSRSENELVMRSDLFISALTELVERIRPKYEEILWATGPSPLALTCSGITGNVTRHAGAINKCYIGGFAGEADMLLRTSTESTANLLYILYAGPAREKRTREDLAEQFLAFGALEHEKLINKSGATVRNRNLKTGTVAGKPMSAKEFDDHIADVRKVADRARLDFPRFGQKPKLTRWHELSAEDMIGHSFGCIPRFADKDKDLLDQLRNAVTLWNFALHGSSFQIIRSKEKALKGHLFAAESDQGINPGHIAARQALLCWQCVSDVFAAEPLVIGSVFTEIVNRRGTSMIRQSRANSET